MLGQVCLPSTALCHPPGDDGIHQTPPDGESDHPSHHSSGEANFFTTAEGRRLAPPQSTDEVFHFVIYGDRTGGVPAGLKVLRQAVDDTRLIDPDLVMTVGDLIQGYNETPDWLAEMNEFKSIMDELPMPWFPVAGNHDIYWRGQGDPPRGHHEQNYQTHFGPLWYAMRHKQTGFIALYSDEGDRQSNKKGFNDASLQRMSDEQLQFLEKSLQQFSDCHHVFVFLHHPRWIDSRYGGGNWDQVHETLKTAGNVSAVFAGHIHRMQYGGEVDGINYFALATTGGLLHDDFPEAGYLHHMNMVTVRPDSFSVATIPIGSVIDPKDFDETFLTDIDDARKVRPVHQSGHLIIREDGSAGGNLSYRIVNDGQRPLETTVGIQTDDDRWQSSLDHTHQIIQAGETSLVEVALQHPPANRWKIPKLSLQATLIGDESRIELPVHTTPLQILLQEIPEQYFEGNSNLCLRCRGDNSAVRVDSKDANLPDGPLTIEAWVRPANGSGYQGIAAKTESSEYSLFYDEGLVDFSVHLGGKYHQISSKDPLSTERMTHVAGVFDGTEIRLYLNGQLVARKPASGKRKTNRLPLWIGADPDRSGEASRTFQGDIDEFRLSNTAVYSGDSIDVQPRLAVQDQTMLMFHFDRQLGPVQIDEAHQTLGIMLPDASLVVPAER